MEQPPQSKREHLRQLVKAKNEWSAPLSPEDRARGFRGWHERGYLPHCDKPGLIQFITFRLWDSMPPARKREWEHLLAAAERSDAPRFGEPDDASRDGAQSIASPDDKTRAPARREASRAQRIKLEDYLDRGLGECFLRDPRVAALMENSMRYHHGARYELLAWVVMPNHVHALIEVGDTPLSKTIQNWKSIAAVKANKLLVRTGDFWQLDYWDTFMRDEAQQIKAVRYIENNPVKAKLCRASEDWPFSSARFRDPQTRELKLPK
jgi:REP element-mobilizing transposase RayT